MVHFSKNLRIIRKEKKVSTKTLAERLDVTPGTIINYENGVSSPDIYTISAIAEYFKLTIDELLLRDWSNEGSYAQAPSANSFNTDVQDGKIIMYAATAPISAKAGYLSSYEDPEYIASLPKLPWVVSREHKGHYMCFEVIGDSMDDGTSESRKQGDIVLGREVGRDLWLNSKLHIHKWDFVIVHKEMGIVIKRIIAHDVKKGLLTLHSLNSLFYPDIIVAVDDIAQIFNVVQSLRR